MLHLCSLSNLTWAAHVLLAPPPHALATLPLLPQLQELSNRSTAQAEGQQQQISEAQKQQNQVLEAEQQQLAHEQQQMNDALQLLSELQAWVGVMEGLPVWRTSVCDAFQARLHSALPRSIANVVSVWLCLEVRVFGTSLLVCVQP